MERSHKPEPAAEQEARRAPPWAVLVALIVGLVAGALLSCRAPDAAIVPLASRHLGEWPTETVYYGKGEFVVSEERETEYDETNPGLAAQWDVADEWRVEAGAYENSFSDVAPYVGATWDAYASEDYEVGLGLAVAYYDSLDDLVPLFGPYLSARVGPVWPRITVGPAGDGDGYLATLSLRIPWP